MIFPIFRFTRKRLRRGRLARSRNFHPLTEAQAAIVIMQALRPSWYSRLRDWYQVWWGRQVYPLLHRWRAGAPCPKCAAPVWHRSWNGEPQARRTCPPRCEYSLGAPADYTWQRSWQPTNHEPQWEDA